MGNRHGRSIGAVLTAVIGAVLYAGAATPVLAGAAAHEASTWQGPAEMGFTRTIAPRVIERRLGEAFGPEASVVARIRGRSWVLLQYEIRDEEIPQTVHILMSTRTWPRKTLYMEPGAMNFVSAFFTSQSENIALYMVRHRYLVIGVDSREDNLSPTANDPWLAEWGLTKRRADLEKVIAAVQGAFPLPHDVLGFSLGGVVALDHAAGADLRPKKVMVLDGVGPYDPTTEPSLVEKATDAYWAYSQLIQDGAYAYDFFNGFKQLIAAAKAVPAADSGVSRPFGYPGDFTFYGLFGFAVLYAKYLPGAITPLTGLPDAWYLEQGWAAGTYQFAEDPLADTWALSQSPADTAAAAVNLTGSGILATATQRDVAAVQAGLAAHPIDWQNIKSRVVWINGQFSMGNHPYAARLIDEGRQGQRKVQFTVVPGYAHVDMVFGTSANRDVWPLLLR